MRQTVLMSILLSMISSGLHFGAKAQSHTSIAVFFEPGFPSVDGVDANRRVLQHALAGWNVEFLNLDSMKTKLNPAGYSVLVLPYGSAFPKQGFSTLAKFLADGGNVVNLGGTPFSIPVGWESAAWRSEVPQTQYHKLLGITQAFEVSAKSISAYASAGIVDGSKALLGEFHTEGIYELYYRFAETIDFPNESGTSGARDAVLRPLVNGVSDQKQRLAAPVVVIDRMQGPYAGGRWVLANFRGSITAKAIRTLVEIALRGPSELSVRPSFSCYRENELPSFSVHLQAPRGNVAELTQGECFLDVQDNQGRRIDKLQLRLHGGGTIAVGTIASQRKSFKPGLYSVSAVLTIPGRNSRQGYSISSSNGFWVMNQKLMEAGKPLSVKNDYFERDGKPYPVTGTTYMGSDVHRKFLFEPNPPLWDSDFAEMKKAGVNMVRTGVWTGWRILMPDVGSPNEGALRALDAFVLTARNHDIPVIFTFFAFLPESWGGINAYLDPRAVNAQKQFIALIVNRYRGVRDIIWDLINEPSFCNPQYLWNCRPNFDKYEADAWSSWLKERYPEQSDDVRLSRLQKLYRAAGNEPLALPRIEEFSNLNIFNDVRPIKITDYRIFAQETFSRWAKDMTGAIRMSGNPNQLITVGQDEGGTNEGPSPHFFAPAVDFTCVHNWWLNDDLVWDNAIMKAPGKPNLVEETGVMFYEKMDGSAWRTEEEARNLLERKAAVSFGAGGAGFIEWIWNTNPYMKSDNEAAIGFQRVDGTAKPELEPFSRIARFFADNKHFMRNRRPEEIVMVVPHSQMYSTRNLATEATRRCVRVMTYHCRMPMSSVSEYQLDSLRVFPRLLVVPSPGTLNEQAWQHLLKRADEGAVVLITGPLDQDDHWLPQERSRSLGRNAITRAVTQAEFLSIDGREYLLGYRGEKIQRVEKAVLDSSGGSTVQVVQRGKGKIIWAPLPVELAEPVEPTVALYDFALRQAHCTPGFTVEPNDASILVLPSQFEDATLYSIVSESDRDTNVKLTHGEAHTPFQIHLPAQRAAHVFVSRKDGKVISELK